MPAGEGGIILKIARIEEWCLILKEKNKKRNKYSLLTQPY